MNIALRNRKNGDRIITNQVLLVLHGRFESTWIMLSVDDLATFLNILLY
jgi:hypothetical protein